MNVTPAVSHVDLNAWLAAVNVWYSGGSVVALKSTFSMLVKAAIKGPSTAFASAVDEVLIALRSVTVCWIDCFVGAEEMFLTIVASAFAHIIETDCGAGELLAPEFEPPELHAASPNPLARTLTATTTTRFTHITQSRLRHTDWGPSSNGLISNGGEPCSEPPRFSAVFLRVAALDSGSRSGLCRTRRESCDRGYCVGGDCCTYAGHAAADWAATLQAGVEPGRRYRFFATSR